MPFEALSETPLDVRHRYQEKEVFPIQKLPEKRETPLKSDPKKTKNDASGWKRKEAKYQPPTLKINAQFPPIPDDRDLEDRQASFR
jgi:hypothetical protein